MKTLETIARMTLADRPRVVIALGDVPPAPTPTPPDGISLVLLPSKFPPSSVGEFVKEFLYGIIHDHSLPTALKGATFRAGSQLSSSPCLISDPLSIQDLRLKDALVTVLHEALDLHTAPSIDPALNLWYPPEMVNFVVAPPETVAQTAVSSSIDQVLGLNGDFTREHGGLVPIAQARHSLQNAQKESQKLQRELATLAQDPAIRKILAEHQERCVDITLLRDEPNFDLGLFVRQGEKLQSGADFLLRVQIGRRSCPLEKPQGSPSLGRPLTTCPLVGEPAFRRRNPFYRWFQRWSRLGWLYLILWAFGGVGGGVGD